MADDIKKWTIIAFIIILIGGTALTVFSARMEDTRMRADLLTKTRIAVKTIDPALIAALTGSEADLKSPDYLQLKKRMATIRSADPDIRFTYLMGQQPDGTIFFFVDSEPPDSEDYSPPGQVYTEATILIRNAFATHDDLTGGPDSDRWGTWVSGVVPVIDPDTGRFIAIFGMDVDARDWDRMVATACLPAVLGTGFVIVLLLTFGSVHERNVRQRRSLEESEKAARESEVRYRSVFENTGTATVILEEDTTISLANTQFERLCGYSKDEIEGKKSWTEFVVKEDLERMLAQHRLRRENKSKALTHYDFRFVTRSGAVRDIHLTIDVIPGTKKSVASLTDITERRQMELALTKTNEKLNLLSSITRHDILNKITALYAYLDLSREICTSPAQCEHIDKEIETIQALQRQVEFTKYYQDIGVRAPEWQDIEAVFARAVSQIRLEGIAVETSCNNYQIYADPLIEKVFYNMVENSIRHGGHVTSIQLIAEETGDSLLVLYQDNGVGIPADVKEKLFQRDFGKHTGMGLFLSREILAITGILITENGEPGKGARFWITVPKGAYRFTNVQ
jgi:PAS domain S-box-containing protein